MCRKCDIVWKRLKKHFIVVTVHHLHHPMIWALVTILLLRTTTMLFRMFCWILGIIGRQQVKMNNNCIDGCMISVLVLRSPSVCLWYFSSLFSYHPTENRYTTWSNIPIDTALPEYSVATSENMPNTEFGAESQGDNWGTSNGTTPLNSLPYTTTSAPPPVVSAPPLNVVSSDELITGPVTISLSHPPPNNETETTICPEKQSIAAESSSNVGYTSHNSN